MEEFFSVLNKDLVGPIVALLVSALVVIINKYLNNMSKRFTIDAEIKNLETRLSVRRHIIDIIDKEVETAVASNMQLSETMKSGGKKLTNDQVRDLNRIAKNMITASLPDSLTEDGGELLEILGGRECFDSIVDNLIEKYVWANKLKKKESDNNSNNSYKSVNKNKD